MSKKLLIQYFASKKSEYSKERAVNESSLPYLSKYTRGMKSLLDVGCGDGSLLQLAATDAANSISPVCGIDLCKPLLLMGQSNKQASAVTQQIEFILADATHMPFQAGTFDMSYAITLFHHVYGNTYNESLRMQHVALSEIGRVTKTLIIIRELCPRQSWMGSIAFWLTRLLSELAIFKGVIAFSSQKQLIANLREAFGNSAVLEELPWREKLIFPISIHMPGRKLIIKAEHY